MTNFSDNLIPGNAFMEIVKTIEHQEKQNVSKLGD